MILVVIVAPNRHYVTHARSEEVANVLIEAMKKNWDDEKTVGYIYENGEYEEVR